MQIKLFFYVPICLSNVFFLYFSSALINFTYLAFTIENIAEFILTKVRLRNSQSGFSSLKNFYADGLKI